MFRMAFVLLKVFKAMIFLKYFHDLALGKSYR